MKDYGNLWDEALGEEDWETTGNVVELLRAQCANLEKSTGGKVRARFDVPKAVDASGTVMSVQALAQSIQTVTMAVQRKGFGDSRVDANSLYSPEQYVFEVYTGTYRFRLFSLDLYPVYPLVLTFDEGVYDEAGPWPYSAVQCDDEISSVAVDDDDELMQCFKLAVSTQRVSYILKRLMEEAEGKAEAGSSGDGERP